MRRITKRGTEKPIEIFVALFVILAVALVMLKLFQSQITEQTTKISKLEQEQKAKELRQKLELECSEKCKAASNNGCSLQSLAALCLANSDEVLEKESLEYLDLDGDGVNTLNIEEFGGEGVCEDKIYCFNFGVSCCAQKIDFSNCANILDRYWESKGWAAGSNQRDRLCETVLDTGNCASTDASYTENKVFAWYESNAFSTVCSTT